MDELQTSAPAKQSDAVVIRVPRCAGAVRTGLRPSSVFRVLSGVAMVQTSLPDGRRQVLRFVLPGEHLWLPETGQLAYSWEAVQQTELLPLSGSIDEAERLAIAQDELLAAYQVIFAMGMQSARERVASFLLDFKTRWRNARYVPLPMKRHDLADHLGLAPETVSRTLSRLSAQGLLVVTSRDATILDESRLREIVYANGKF